MFASFRSRLHTKTIFVPEVRLFSISLLVCEFNPHRQTWYQKFIGTYPPLHHPVKNSLNGTQGTRLISQDKVRLKITEAKLALTGQRVLCYFRKKE